MLVINGLRYARDALAKFRSSFRNPLIIRSKFDALDAPLTGGRAFAAYALLRTPAYARGERAEFLMKGLIDIGIVAIFHCRKGERSRLEAWHVRWPGLRVAL